MRGPGFESLSQEEKDKLKAASEKAMQDSKVKEAREKMEVAGKEFREAMQAAQVAADPSIEPILKKLQEAREKAEKEGGGRRPGGDQPKP
jgi:DNA-binding ferritin-like protein